MLGQSALVQGHVKWDQLNLALSVAWKALHVNDTALVPHGTNTITAYSLHTNVERAEGTAAFMDGAPNSLAAWVDGLLDARDQGVNACSIRLLTLLRDPVAHPISSFEFDGHRRHGRHYSSFASYVGAHINGRCAAPDMQLSFLVGRWEESKMCRRQPLPSSNLTWALDRLRRFDHVGVTERLNETIAWLTSELKIELRPTHGNASSNGTVKAEHKNKALVGRTESERSWFLRLAASSNMSAGDRVLYEWALHARGATSR